MGNWPWALFWGGAKLAPPHFGPLGIAPGRAQGAPLLLWLAFDSEVQHPHYTSDQEFKSALPSGFDHQQLYSNGTGEFWTGMIPVPT